MYFNIYGKPKYDVTNLNNIRKLINKQGIIFKLMYSYETNF